MQRPRTHFISDLHLFSRRSSAPAIQQAIERTVAGSDRFILGGDIFDFRWSSLESHEETIERSVEWLRGLLLVNTSCQFHYILGNHDALPGFTERLHALTQDYPQLQWHKHLLRLDRAIFLHGDIIDAAIPLVEDFHEQLDARRIAHEHRPRPHPMRHTLYDAVVATRIHRAIAHFANPNPQVLTRVTDYLRWAGHTVDTGLERVYFGHTHRPIDSLEQSGLIFSNPGAAIKSIPFRILPVPDHS